MQAASARQLWLHRLLMRYSVFAGFAIASVVGLVVLLGRWQGTAALAALGLLVAAYTAFWFGLCFWVNSLGKSAAWNAVALAAAWLAVVLVLPQLGLLLVDRVAPAPSKVALVRDLRDISNRLRAEGDEPAIRYYREQPALLAGGKVPDLANFLNFWYAVQQLTDREIAARVHAYEAAAEQRDRALDRIALLSPAAILQAALTDLAGTHPARHREFRAQLLAHREVLRQHLEPLVFADAPVKAKDIAAVSTFQFDETRASGSTARVSRAAAQAGSLALVLTVLGLRRVGASGMMSTVGNVVPRKIAAL